MKPSSDYKDRILRFLLQVIGVILILGGVFSFVVGPVEIYTYSLFTEGGRFHFDGFGIVSLMFAMITVQVAGYYAIAFIAIPLGWGHLKFKPWTRKATLTLIWDWMVIGLPLTIIAFFMLLTSKNLPSSILPVLILAFITLYPAGPLLARWFYHRPGIQNAFKSQGDSPSWIDKPQIILVSTSLMAFTTLALHLPLLFNGIFPFFNQILSGLNGYMVIDGCILLSTILTWGLYRGSLTAWSVSIVYLVALITSSISAFLLVPPAEIFSLLDLAEIEMAAVRNIPLQGYMLAIFFSLPLFVCLGLLLVSKKHYTLVKSDV
jgi:hypothetical protein